MRVGDPDEVIDAVAAARDAGAEFQERVHELKAAMRRCELPEVRHELVRVEAYDALVGRDEGMGISMAGWLDEIERVAEGDTG